MINDFAKHLIDVVLPPKCLSCGEFTEGVESLCTTCWGNIDFVTDNSCSICSHPFEYYVGENALCSSCTKSPPNYDRLKYVFIYNENSRRLITGFKYSDKTYAAKAFAKWMVKAGKDFLDEIDIIVPVPLHRVRLFTRRYNQSALIANKIGLIKNIMVVNDLLLKIKNSPAQASLNKRQRLWNVKNVFRMNHNYKEFIKGKNVLLIDDVITTGATIQECSKILRKAKVQDINVLTLASTVQKG